LKIKKLNEIKRIIRQARKKYNVRVVFTNGCFDLVHLGHISYLQRAKELGDILVVGVNSDSSVRRIKGKPRPITPEKDRAVILAALECVDYVVIFKEDTPLKLIKAIRPDVLVKGADWPKNKVVGYSTVKSYGGQLRLIPFLKGRSTTGLIKKIVKAYRKIL